VALDIIFSFWFTFHLVLTIFPFPVSTAEFIGEFGANTRSATSDVAPTVLALRRSLRLKAKRGEFAAPIRSFRGFLLFAALHLLAENESQRQ
jgi:hypothetical protein